MAQRCLSDYMGTYEINASNFLSIPLPTDAEAPVGICPEYSLATGKAAVKAAAKVDPRNVSRQQKAQDAGIAYLLRKNSLYPKCANGVTASGNRATAPSLSTFPHEGDVPSTTPTPSTFVDHATSTSRDVAPEKRDPEIQTAPGQLILDQNMKPVFRKPWKRRSMQQIQASKITKDRGGVCPKHKHQKKSVSSEPYLLEIWHVTNFSSANAV